MGFWCGYRGPDARTFDALTGSFSGHIWDWCNGNGTYNSTWEYNYSTGEFIQVNPSRDTMLIRMG
jgi:hypothetical protein